MHSGRFRHRPAMFWKAGNVLHVAIMLMYSEVKRKSHRDAQSHRDPQQPRTAAAAGIPPVPPRQKLPRQREPKFHPKL